MRSDDLPIRWNLTHRTLWFGPFISRFRAGVDCVGVALRILLDLMEPLT